ncbi:MAG TPA: cupredoxin family copper-binding protein [Candidatus Baltobacteraceae bacterium]|nr:cupredoxin family copper-binding protein [Candidatus Baltobacteraceae bacterium]
MKAAFALAALLCTAASATVLADTQSHVVTISDFAYKPEKLTVAVGDTVRFENKDDVGHTVTAKDGSFDSQNIDTGKSWTYTFSTAGTYEYFCTVHPSMKGSVTAQ